VTLEETQLVVSALGGLRSEEPRQALLTLVAVAHSRQLRDVEDAVKRALAQP
jgi:hypothetical protein